MKRVVKRELCELFTKSHYKIVFGIVEFKKNVNATVCNHTINKWVCKWISSFEFPVTIDKVLQSLVRQKFRISYIVSRLFNCRLNRFIKLSYVSRYFQFLRCLLALRLTFKALCRCGNRIPSACKRQPNV